MSAKQPKPWLDQPAKAWRGGTWAKRLMDCALLLCVHGFLGDAAKTRIYNRIAKAVQKRRLEVRPLPPKKKRRTAK